MPVRRRAVQRGRLRGDVQPTRGGRGADLDARAWSTTGYTPKNVDQDAHYLAFKNGKNAFNWNGIWQINDLKKSPDVNWGVAPLPQIGTKQAAWANSHNFTIVQQTRGADANKVAAAKVFISWMSEHSLDWAAGGQVPARKSVREEPASRR